MLASENGPSTSTCNILQGEDCKVSFLPLVAVLNTGLHMWLRTYPANVSAQIRRLMQGEHASELTCSYKCRHYAEGNQTLCAAARGKCSASSPVPRRHPQEDGLLSSFCGILRRLATTFLASLHGSPIAKSSRPGNTK